MKIEKECLECIFKQSTRVSKFLKVSPLQAKHIATIAQQHIERFDHSNTPPHNATPMYEAVANYLQIDDIYAKMKADATKSALRLVSTCKANIEKMEDRLEGVIKTAIAGNAGEQIFDKICIEVIKELYPDIKIYYFVRGKPIINDLTLEDAKKSGLDEVATLVDSGVPTPGFVQEFATKEANRLFESADCIISKGMGNYECLGEKRSLPIYFLLKVKCQVVARSIKAELGDIVCKQL